MLTTLGGYNSNQLLRSLDYGLIRDNPKILCGFSDITALATAIHVKTDLVTYSGPHYSTFAMKRGIEYTLAHFERCLMQEGPTRSSPPTTGATIPGTPTRRTVSSSPTPVTRS